MVASIQRDEDTSQRIPKPPVKRQARNIDDQNNKRRVTAMFEDSGSEQESEKEIKTTVDRIVEASEKADETNSESAVVDVSNSHVMTLLHQSLAVTNEILIKINSIERSQREMMRSIEDLFSTVNPVVNLTPHDVPEQHEASLTMFTPGIPEQPQLEISLECSQNVSHQNVSPVFSFDLPEQPHQGNQIVTINTNDLRDCVASAAHPEMGEFSKVIDIDMDTPVDTLVKLNDKACSETNFAVQLFKKLFKDEEIKNKNVSGAKGKEPLDPVRIEKNKTVFF